MLTAAAAVRFTLACSHDRAASIGAMRGPMPRSSRQIAEELRVLLLSQ